MSPDAKTILTGVVQGTILAITILAAVLAYSEAQTKDKEHNQRLEKFYEQRNQP